MKKYNLSNIMKRAWELVKKSAMTISSGLKKAWEEAKHTMKGTEKQITWAKELMRKMNKEFSIVLGMVPENQKVRIFGPVQESIGKIQDEYRKVIYLKAEQLSVLTGIKNKLEK